MLRLLIIFGLTVTLAATPVKADTIHNVAMALDFAGFDARGSRNPLSGGVDLLINRQFNGNVFDFGGTELALQGPISLQMSTGGRILPEFDVSFSTSLNSRSQVNPLNFTYVSDIGPQSTIVTGSMLIDGRFTIDALGFYDLTLTSSRRSTVSREGIVTDSGNFDSDLGPIAVSGNIFADALAVLVDPLFEQAGRENPFNELSKLIAGNGYGLADLISASDPDAEIFMLGQRELDFNPAGLVRGNHGRPGSNVIVPEPTVLALLLLGLPIVIHRARRIR